MGVVKALKALKYPRLRQENCWKHTCAIPIDFETISVLEPKIFDTFGFVSILVLKGHLWGIDIGIGIERITSGVSILVLVLKVVF